MTISEARLYLEHTSIDDFNLEEHQKQNRYEAIQVLLSTIDKAIEYIEDNVAVYAFNDKRLPHWEMNDDEIKELLDILKGGDSNEIN